MTKVPALTWRRQHLLLLAVLLAVSNAATAGDGRLLATGGATQFEGSAGGGLVPWAVMSGYGTGEQNGGTVFLTRIDTGDYTLEAAGLAYTFGNRLELSYARQRLGLGELQRRLALPTGGFNADVMGAKLRLRGDLVYTRGPQLSLGVQHKRLLDFAVPGAVGARDDRGTDLYLAASKLFLAAADGRHLLVNATLRSTRANQAGLLGFGGDRRAARSLVLESSVAVMLDPHWAIGMEYRQKPDNLRFAREDDWKDAFLAWFPNKHLAVVAAYVDLGSIATLERQRGAYLSVQASF